MQIRGEDGRLHTLVGGVSGKSSRVELRGAWRIESSVAPPKPDTPEHLSSTQSLYQLNSELVILHPHRCSLHSTHLQQVIVTAYTSQLILRIYYTSPHLVILYFTTSRYLITRFIPNLGFYTPRTPQPHSTRLAAYSPYTHMQSTVFPSYLHRII